ncbi:hypothetical protein C7212DRAFT_290712 [Tuber magnatum]|uniref:Uncharacterized protein n=1 Tax=Tuber magnatum TaxID=42249 RepID=A0A317SZL8_9PEZI|nr:hypothetical protein C7212DRAFT_290712 [Tuber magnatum]
MDALLPLVSSPKSGGGGSALTLCTMSAALCIRLMLEKMVSYLGMRLAWYRTVRV